MLRPGPFPETRPSLLRSLRDRDAPASAWREFFECYAPSVYRVARRRGLGAEDADDVVQQVMLAVSTHLADFRYDRDRGRFRQWIKTITGHKICDFYRHRDATPDRTQLDGLDGYPGPADEAAALWDEEWRIQDLRHCLLQVAREIAPKRFEAFELYVLQGVSAEETARRLDMTRTHVYVTRTQVIRRVRELMEELGG
jgi:RNA polymerase sigma factor (sigma-70 family)